MRDRKLPSPAGECWGGGTRRALLIAGLAGMATRSFAGAQIEEPLADSVRTALSSAIANSAPPVPEFTDTDSRLSYLRWLGAMSRKLQRRLPEWQERKEFLQTVWYESRRAGLDTTLVLGLIQVESNFRKFAVSRAGARGFMQVMPFWTRLIGTGDPSVLFHMQSNLRFGCVILRHYLDRERGDLYMALGRYNGSRGRPQYPNAVFGASRNWEFRDALPPPASADPTKPADKVLGGP